MKFSVVCSVMAALLISPVADAAFAPDDLPRRAFLGLTVRDAPSNQLKVVGTVPGSSAASADFEVNDILLDVNGTAVNSLPSFFAALKPFRPGDQVATRVRRGDKELSITTTL